MARCANEFLASPPRLRPRAGAMPPARMIARLGVALRHWRQRARDRRIVAQLNERELRDMGLTRGDLYRELYGPRRG